MKQPRKSRESGFALLLVFLVAAVIGITLYSEIPRVAFDAQRQRELLLISRGEQFKRAIQLFVKKNQRYPARIEELESFNNVRYLRRRYKDPITGKDEWKLIMVGPGGVFTNSLVNKPQQSKDQKSGSQNTFIGEGPAIGSTGSTGGQATNPALRRRASEGGQPGGTVLGPDGQPVQPQIAATQHDPNAGVQSGGMAGVSGIPGATGATGAAAPTGPQFAGLPPGMPGSAANTPAGQYNPAMPGTTLPGARGTLGGSLPSGMVPGVPGATGTANTGGSTSGSSGSSFVGGGGAYIGGGSFVGGGTSTTGNTAQRYPGQPGSPVNSQIGGVSPYSTAQGANGFSPSYGQPGTNIASPSAAATGLINQLLTSPRQGGMPTANAGMQGLNLGPGIAGVASTSEDEGILVYNEHTKYIEWEFIYDPTKDRKPQDPRGVAGTPASQLGSNPQSGNGSNPAGNSSGSFSGFGNSSGSSFGGGGFGGGGFGTGGTQPGRP